MSFGKNPGAELQTLIDNFDNWKELVSSGNAANLDGLSLYDFFLKLDKAIDRNKKQLARIEKMKSKNG